MFCFTIVRLNSFTPLKVFIFSVIFFSINGKKTRKKLANENEYNEDYNADVYCKSQSRLIKMEKFDEITIVDSFINNSVLLQCKYCEERDNGLPRSWDTQKQIFTGTITEVQESMDNNDTFSPVFVTNDHSLVLKNIQEDDMGLYFCKAPYVNTPGRSFNYLLDLTNKSKNEVGGTMLDFKNYTEIVMGEVNKAIAGKTFLNKTHTNLKVFTDWSEWSECDSCFRTEGIRYRIGRCRLRFFFENCNDSNSCAHNLRFDENQNTEPPVTANSNVADLSLVKEHIVGYGIALACRSLLLQKLSFELYTMTASIPDFILSAKCSAPCKGRSVKQGPRYRKSIILATGAHLTLVCPDSTIDSQVRWEHNKRRLYPNEGENFVPRKTEPRLYVDSFNTLYLFEVTDKESGNFTCFVDGVQMQEVKIIVLTRSIFFTKEFARHLKYLGFVFILCFIIYLATIIVTCVKSQAEKKNAKNVSKNSQDSQKLLEKKTNYDSDYSS